MLHFLLGLILWTSVNAIDNSSSNNYLSWNILDEPKCKNDPDFGLNTCELVRSKGYPCEAYSVQTPDNYILEVHRIPNGNGYKGDATKKPVMFLQHGMLGASDNFVLNFAHNSLGFLAYDKGYDVWMGNYRGNKYSSRHTQYGTRDIRFWMFGWNKMAEHDLPSMIDRALRESGQKKLHYVGHSMGTTAFLAFLAVKPEYNQKIASAALLSPVATLKYSTNPVFLLAPVHGILPVLTGMLGSTPGQLFPNSAFYIKFAKKICTSKLLEKACQFLVKTVMQEGPQFNQTRLCVYLNAFPSGSSTYAAMHYAQMKTAPTFRNYDYGLANIVKYGSLKPPVYDVSKITIPVALFWSAGDDLNHPKDLEFLTKNLGHVALNKFIPDPSFSHLDFAIGLNANDLVYTPTFEFFDKYPSST